LFNKAVQDSLRLTAASGEQSQESWFVRVWKALLGCSMKEREDIPVIISNLTGFSAIDSIKREGMSERMRTLMMSLNWVPLDVLLIDCPSRYSAEAPHPDQWMPLVPRGGTLGSNSFLVWEKEGYWLELSKNHRLFPIGGNQVQAPVFELSAERSSNKSSYRSPIIRVNCLGPLKQPVQPQTEKKQYMLLENFHQDTRLELRGALLHLVRQSGNKTLLHYDDTVRATLRDGSAKSDAPKSYLMKPPTTSVLYLERSKYCHLPEIFSEF
jgi:hypothetical protein